ncbi:type II secretion system F family protein [Kordiimonas lacus]|uniref:Tight adherence protein B n=1 Tax=Kordiimonas lacus TaxID=637679 RepID=A0A1G6Y5M6_9PROT|nr:type II secretion system F family protein [Kordiimonas lacus]SDD85592.1 tight adherence protein B [Kordiimonas lacus]
MQGANLNIILLAGGLTTIILIVLGFFVAGMLSKGRKETRARLEQFKARFENKTTLKGEQSRSIRVRQSEAGFAGMIAEMLPRQDQIQKRLAQAGLEIQLSKYAAVSFGIAVISAGVFMVMGFGWVLGAALGIILGFGLPHMWVSGRINKRKERFTKQFPEAMDLMVRGLKSGLPVNECIANVAKEMSAPTGVEFQKITDAMRLGKQLEEALWETADRLDTPDFKFFVISLVVQRETGGNLGETLGNLANILRSRQAMKLKVRALSSEAKASAWIVGALPFIMLGAILAINYDYGIILFTHPKAIMAGLGGLLWMSLGIFIMSRMIKFEV